MEPRDKDPNPCRVIGVLDDGIASLNATPTITRRPVRRWMRAMMAGLEAAAGCR